MIRFLAVLAALGIPRPLCAQTTDDPSPHSDAQLVAEVTAIQPGKPFTVALRLLMDEGWHSYWRNPGDAGSATTIEWHLPEGFAAGDIQWPHPSRIEAPPLVSYGYDHEVFLLTQITPPEKLVVGSVVSLRGQADWVVCEEICLPATAQLALELPVREQTTWHTRWRGAVADARAKLPVNNVGWEVAAGRTATGFLMELTPPAGWDGDLEGAYFFSSEAGVIAHAAPQQLRRDGRTFQISLPLSEFAGQPVERLQGIVLLPAGVSWTGNVPARSMTVDVALSGEPGAVNLGLQRAGGNSLTLVVALLFAFLGGLILNLMPCVFPVLSIKILGFVSQGGEDKARTRINGLAFGAGVLLTFWLLAGLLLAFRAGGTQLGWGFQLQSPMFVAALAGLFFLLGLSLMGVFEVGTWLTRTGEWRVGRSGYGNSFSSGVLATIVATPCIAPFMGAALGFALIQPPVQTLLVFGSLGVGMATPYVALSTVPSLLRLLPRPGAWMETLRQVLAFPLFATVIWLVWVFGVQTGINGAAYLMVGLLLLGLAAWIIGRWNPLQASPRRYAVTRALAAGAALTAIVLALQGTRSETVREPEGLWRPFSTAAVEQLRAAGRPVFIDFTAAWCLSCKVNERIVLAAAEVERAFRERDVVLVKADWTRRDLEITRALESFGRSGVPLYVLYPDGNSAPPVVLPVILTRQIVLDALEQIPTS